MKQVNSISKSSSIKKYMKDFIVSDKLPTASV